MYISFGPEIPLLRIYLADFHFHTQIPNKVYSRLFIVVLFAIQKIKKSKWPSSKLQQYDEIHGIQNG